MIDLLGEWWTFETERLDLNFLHTDSLGKTEESQRLQVRGIQGKNVAKRSHKETTRPVPAETKRAVKKREEEKTGAPRIRLPEKSR